MSDRPKDPQTEGRAAVDAETARRDQAVEHMLSRRTDGRAVPQDCPDPEVVAAYMDRSLDEAETARCEEHFANCPRCQDVLSALTASENVEVTAADAVAAAAPAAAARREFARDSISESPAPQRSVWRWLVPLAVAVAALLLWLDLRPKVSSTPDNSLVATNTPAQAPAAQPASAPPPAGPIDESKTEQMTPGDRKKDLQQSQLNGSPGANARTKKQLGGSADRTAAASGAFGNTASRDSRVNQALADESAFEKSAISNVMPTPLPLPGQPPAEAPSAVVGGAVGPPPQNALVDGGLAAGRAGKAELHAAQGNSAPSAGVQAKEQGLSRAPSARQMLGSVSQSVEVVSGDPGTILVTPTSGDMVWRIGPRGRIERSTDSGNTWRPTPAGVTADLLAGSAPANDVLWIVGRSGTILRTTDGGAHWAHPTSPANGTGKSPDWSSVVAIDADHATISSITGQSFVTTDGGATWNPRQ